MENTLGKSAGGNKTLDLLSVISDLAESADGLTDFLQGVVACLENALGTFGIEFVRIVYDGKEYHRPPFQETSNRYTEDLVVRGKLSGTVDVFFNESAKKKRQQAPGGASATLLPIVAMRLGDILSRRRAEEELARSEEHYALAQRSANIGSWDWDITTGDLKWSETIEPMFGFSPGEFAATIESFYECVHPDDRRRVAAAVTAAVESGADYRIDHRIIWPNGTVRWVVETGNVLRNPAGQAVRMLGIVQDITQRKKTEKMLADTIVGTSTKTGQDFFRSLVRQLSTALGMRYALIGELMPSEKAKVRTRAVWAGDDFSADFEYELAGTPCQEVIGGTTCVYDSRVQQLHPNDLFLHGKQVESYLGTPVKDSDGQPLGIMVLLNDKPISSETATLACSLLELFAFRVSAEIERTRAEAQREELVAVLERQNEELEHFAYTVSHDLKAPLITITGFLGALQEDVNDGKIEQTKANIDRITEAAATMFQLLDSTLEFSRIGRTAAVCEQVAMEDIAQQAVALFEAQIAERGVSLDVVPPFSIVHGDRLRLMQIWQNLIENAIKYLGDQASPRIEIGARQEGLETVFYVKDNGIGIDPPYHEKVFGLFEKLDARIDGTGVGLALVKRIVEIHGGRIWIESEGIGHGSTFCFTIPDQQPAR